MKALCGAQRLIHFGGDEQQTVECAKRRGHRGRKHRATWWAGKGGRLWEITVRWT